jgi:Uma2 family endonuclease
MLTEVYVPELNIAPELFQPDLDEGEEQKRASGLHGYIGSILNQVIGHHVRTHKLGFVFESSTTYNFKDNRPKRQPDVSFVSKAKLSYPKDTELDVPPDLAVEIVSRNDTFYEIETKLIQYQAVGVKLIWLISPLSQTVLVYRLGNGLTPQGFGGSELQVSSIFEGLSADDEQDRAETTLNV